MSARLAGLKKKQKNTKIIIKKVSRKKAHKNTKTKPGKNQCEIQTAQKIVSKLLPFLEIFFFLKILTSDFFGQFFEEKKKSDNIRKSEKRLNEDKCTLFKGRLQPQQPMGLWTGGGKGRNIT